MKKKHTADFKAQVVQETPREQKSVNQIADEHAIHPNQLYAWRTTTLAGLPSLFSDQRTAAVYYTGSFGGLPEPQVAE